MTRNASNQKINIIFEDNHLLVIEKPVNIPSQSDESGDLDILTLLKQDLKKRFNKPGNVYLGLVHRLDRPVGGVMVFAKTSKAASRISELIRKREFNKNYIAVVHGIMEQKEGKLTHYLVKDTKTNIVRVTQKDDNKAKEAILEYKLISSKENLSLVKIKLHTGRSHQIRVQFAAVGHPLFGDQKYGIQLNKEGQQISLWSSQIKFEHPVSKDIIVFNSLPPKVYPWNLFNIDEAV